MKTRVRDYIYEWMRVVSKDESYKRFSDLHIDAVDSAFESPNAWVQGGLKCLSIAVAVRNKLNLELSVCLAFALRSGTLPIGINFGNVERLVREFDSTPPSLYLLERKQVHWNKHDRVIISELPQPAPARSYHVEYRERGESDYRRSLWFVIPPNGVKWFTD